ncbi:MAG: hypothetical protein WAV73_04060 [Candidatus Moraniibacteriota bacterium]
MKITPFGEHSYLLVIVSAIGREYFTPIKGGWEMAEETRRMAEADGWIRRILAIYEGVRVKVPAVDLENDNMKLMPEFVDNKGVTVPSRWRYGMIVNPAVRVAGRIVRKAVICNRNFYNISPEDFGKKITAKVVIIEKTRGDQSFRMVDITKTVGVPVVSKLRISRDGLGFLIPGTKFWIRVVPRKFPEKIAKAA